MFTDFFGFHQFSAIFMGKGIKRSIAKTIISKGILWLTKYVKLTYTQY